MALSASPPLLERAPFRLIGAINDGANFPFGAICGVLDTHWPRHGGIHWQDCLQFSFAARASIGYGD